MTKKKTTKEEKNTSESGFLTPSVPGIEINDESDGVETTGRYIIIFKDEAIDDGAGIKSTLNNVAGLRHMITPADYESGAVAAAELAEDEVLHFNNLGIAVVSGEDAMQSLAASTSDADSPILAIEPEYIAYPSNARLTGQPLDYLRGYRDAVNNLYDQLTSEEHGLGAQAQLSASFQDTLQFTWGLQATRVSASRYSGQGIKVAVLDTGLDLDHPDFRGRAITSSAFVAGVTTAQDIHGHGTHCVGTACGSQLPATGVRRYGVAFGAQIFVGKVFNNAPRPQAPTASVVAGIEWAIANGCRVASLSLGALINQKIMQYEVPIRRALNAGLLVVAAAGNNASRPMNPGFVEPPANADAAMAVAALDSHLQIAKFSARSSQVTGIGGIVNIAGPGVAVFSSVPIGMGLHSSFNGTSMATPHVAGIAALWAEATGESGNALWNRLQQSAFPLNLPSADVGAGLVQAPQ